MLKKENAIKYLRLLHEVEENYRSSILTQDITAVIQELRLEFIKAYNSS